MTDEPAPPQGATCAQMLDWAERTGRIAARSRAIYEQGWAADSVRYDAFLRITAPVRIGGESPGAVAAIPAQLPPSAVARERAAATSPAASQTASQTASGLDVTPLPPRMRRAAALLDRVAAASVLQRYAGMTDAEVDPFIVEQEGYPDLATNMRRNEAEAAQVADDERSANLKAAMGALERQRAEEHYQKHHAALEAERVAWQKAQRGE